jgi:hypothetical protein
VRILKWSVSLPLLFVIAFMSVPIFGMRDFAPVSVGNQWKYHSDVTYQLIRSTSIKTITIISEADSSNMKFYGAMVVDSFLTIKDTIVTDPIAIDTQFYKIVEVGDSLTTIQNNSHLYDNAFSALFETHFYPDSMVKFDTIGSNKYEKVEVSQAAHSNPDAIRFVKLRNVGLYSYQFETEFGDAFNFRLLKFSGSDSFETSTMKTRGYIKNRSIFDYKMFGVFKFSGRDILGRIR